MYIFKELLKIVKYLLLFFKKIFDNLVSDRECGGNCGEGGRDY